eukprot:scaffold34231_cov59-Isochrysis_galbana.AAC.1
MWSSRRAQHRLRHCSPPSHHTRPAARRPPRPARPQMRTAPVEAGTGSGGRRPAARSAGGSGGAAPGGRRTGRGRDGEARRIRRTPFRTPP